MDLKTRTARLSDALPEETLEHDLTPLWIGAGRLLFVARDSDGIRPSAPYLRRATGEKLAAEWNKAWAGREPSASVYRSRRDGGSNPPFKGRLVEFDAAAGTTTVWAEGMYSNLRMSPNRRFVSAVHQFERSQMPVDSLGSGWLYGRGRLVLFEMSGRRRIDVSPDLEIFPGTEEWSPDGAHLGFFAWRDGESAEQGLFRVFAVATRSLTPLPHAGLDLVNEREFGPPGRPLRVLSGWTASRSPFPRGRTARRF